MQGIDWFLRTSNLIAPILGLFFSVSHFFTDTRFFEVKSHRWWYLVISVCCIYWILVVVRLIPWGVGYGVLPLFPALYLTDRKTKFKTQNRFLIRVKNNNFRPIPELLEVANFPIQPRFDHAPNEWAAELLNLIEKAEMKSTAAQAELLTKLKSELNQGLRGAGYDYAQLVALKLLILQNTFEWQKSVSS